MTDNASFFVSNRLERFGSWDWLRHDRGTDKLSKQEAAAWSMLPFRLMRGAGKRGFVYIIPVSRPRQPSRCNQSQISFCFLTAFPVSGVCVCVEGGAGEGREREREERERERERERREKRILAASSQLGQFNRQHYVCVRASDLDKFHPSGWGVWMVGRGGGGGARRRRRRRRKA